MKTILLLLSLTIFESALSQKIDEADVKRIVSVLSNDSLEGRKPFTEGIEVAATFIAEEFEKAGLSPFHDLEDYEQSFQLYNLLPVASVLKLNGVSVPADKHIYIGEQAHVSWRKMGALEVHEIHAADDFATKLNEARNNDGRILVLVDSEHEDQFRRYHQYFSRGSNTLSTQGGNDAVFMVLWDEGSVTAIDFEHEFEVAAKTLTNVVGMIPGKNTDEYVLFTGHYDHLGVMPAVEGDSIANGADDNASGTTAVITLAKYYSEQKKKPERTLVFVTFTAEEMGGYGSQYFSKQLDPDKVVTMFNIEMIGKPSKFGPNTAFITGYDMSDFGEILQKALKGSDYAFHPDPYPEQNLFYRSDNATLARLGVPAHTISSTQIDKDNHYHTVSDNLETLDISHLTNMIRAIAKSSDRIVKGKATPSRVDKASVQ